MFAELRSWLAENREWNRVHRDTWLGYTVAAPFEHTPLVQGCLAEVQKQCVNIPFTTSERRWPREQVVTLELHLAGSDLTVFLYPGTAQISSAARGELFWAEEWSYRTPQEFLGAFSSALAQEVARLGSAAAKGAV